MAIHEIYPRVCAKCPDAIVLFRDDDAAESAIIAAWLKLLPVGKCLFLEARGNDRVNGKWEAWKICTMDQAGNWSESDKAHPTPFLALAAYLESRG